MPRVASLHDTEGAQILNWMSFALLSRAPFSNMGRMMPVSVSTYIICHGLHQCPCCNIAHSDTWEHVATCPNQPKGGTSSGCLLGGVALLWAYQHVLHTAAPASGKDVILIVTFPSLNDGFAVVWTFLSLSIMDQFENSCSRMLSLVHLT